MTRIAPRQPIAPVDAITSNHDPFNDEALKFIAIGSALTRWNNDPQTRADTIGDQKLELEINYPTELEYKGFVAAIRTVLQSANIELGEPEPFENLSLINRTFAVNQAKDGARTMVHLTIATPITPDNVDSYRAVLVKLGEAAIKLRQAQTPVR